MARIDLWIQGVDAALLVRTVRVREVISTPFEVSIVARSHATDIDLDAASWAPASLSLLAGWALVLGGGGRSWSGLVQRIEQVSVEPFGLSTYEILLVPRLFLLTQNKDYRIFQRQTVPAIVKRLLDEWLIDHEWRLDPAAFPSLEYRVQYGESDFAFLARLCEEAGIQKMPKPIVHGMQSAVIQGPADREVFTDEHGRVKVRFFWDREAQDDEQTSCWLRVVQVWTGAGFGIWAIPRVGQEVLVGFLEGNPDEPVVVGHVPNALTPPPYPLPVHQTRTVLRTRSTPESDGYNEISFEDRKGEELLYQRAERDRETWVRRDERELVQGDRVRMVGADEHIAIRGEQREQVDGGVHRTIGGDERVEVGGSASYVIDGDVNIVINGRLGVQVAGDVHLLAGKDVVIEGTDATLLGAGGFARATGGALLASPFVENAGKPGKGGGSSPLAPSPPILPASYGAPPPKKIVRLPVFGQQLGSMSIVRSDEEIICEAICSCKKLADGQAAEGERRKAQICVTQQIRAFDKALNGQSRIKAEVPYDMSTSPPTPIMSRNEPERSTTGRPKGSRIPDVVVLKDGTLPPTQDNIEKVIEIKFPPDSMSSQQQKDYTTIAGNAPLEEWGPARCGCDDGEKEPEPVRVPAEDAAAAALLAALLVLLILDDAVGGEADDVLIPGVVRELAKRLAPILGPGLKAP